MKTSEGQNINYIKNLMRHYKEFNNVTLEDIQKSHLTLKSYIQAHIFGS